MQKEQSAVKLHTHQIYKNKHSDVKSPAFRGSLLFFYPSALYFRTPAKPSRLTSSPWWRLKGRKSKKRKKQLKKKIVEHSNTHAGDKPVISVQTLLSRKHRGMDGGMEGCREEWQCSPELLVQTQAVTVGGVALGGSS